MKAVLIVCASALVVVAGVSPARGQAAVRQGILQAKSRPEPSARDLTVVRNATRGRDVTLPAGSEVNTTLSSPFEVRVEVE